MSFNTLGEICWGPPTKVRPRHVSQALQLLPAIKAQMHANARINAHMFHLFHGPSPAYNFREIGLGGKEKFTRFRGQATPPRALLVRSPPQFTIKTIHVRRRPAKVGHDAFPRRVHCAACYFIFDGFMRAALRRFPGLATPNRKNCILPNTPERWPLDP